MWECCRVPPPPSTSSSSPAAPGSCLRGPRVLPAGLLRDCVVGLLSFMAAAVNMTGCLETICFQWLPHGNRELNLRRTRRLSRKATAPRLPGPSYKVGGGGVEVGGGGGGGWEPEDERERSSKGVELGTCARTAEPNGTRRTREVTALASARARTHKHLRPLSSGGVTRGSPRARQIESSSSNAPWLPTRRNVKSPPPPPAPSPYHSHPPAPHPQHFLLPN